MGAVKLYYSLLSLIIYIYFYIRLMQCCNEAVCISIVSKCLLLIKTCMCTNDNYTCHKNCFDCLGNFNSQCCTCFEFCPMPKEIVDGLNSQSHVEDFPESNPGLFKALTEYPDDFNRWTTVTFPIHINANEYESRKEFKFYRQTDETTPISTPFNYTLSFNCTVIFINNCMSLSKCKRNCYTMGASSYRWFYDGCCECIGEYCIYHGIDNSRCHNCPQYDDEEYDSFDYDYDYFDEQSE